MALVLAGLLLAAAADGSTGPAEPGVAVPVFTFADDRIVESSGLAVSATQDVVWTVNDSGDAARVYGVDREGCTRIDVLLDGVEVRDVEDLAIDPTTSPPTLVVGDVGDNRAVRDDVAVIRVPEPMVALDGPCPAEAPTVSLSADVSTVALEGGAADVEALLVDPRTGDVLLVTKGPDPAPEVLLVRDGRAAVVGVPQLGPNQPAVTGGDIRPDGAVVVLRSYRRAWTYDVADDWSTTFATAASDVRLPVQPQGEAIAWDGDDAWLVSSEDPLGTRPPVLRVPTSGVRRQPATADPTPSGPPSTEPSPTDAPVPADTGRASPSPSEDVAADERAPSGSGAAAVLLLLAVAAVASGVVAVVVRMGRRRAGRGSHEP